MNEEYQVEVFFILTEDSNLMIEKRDLNSF